MKREKNNPHETTGKSTSFPHHLSPFSSPSLSHHNYNIRNDNRVPAWDLTDSLLRSTGEDWNGTVLGHCLYWDMHWQHKAAEGQKESE